MKKLLPLLFLAGLTAFSARAQYSRYVVKFRNKTGTPYTLSAPNAYLSQRAINRRLSYNIPIDSTDLPVNPAYVNQVKAVSNVTLLNVSKWLNAVTIQTTDAAAISTINSFPFVQTVVAVAARGTGGRGEPDEKFERTGDEVTGGITGERVSADYYNYGTNSYNEIHLHNGEFLHNIGLRGQGMQIAMLDNGFNNYNTLKAFDSVRAENRILGTWDFVAREANVSNDGSHGMNCFSTIAANIPGQFIGKAPKASFWLYQTEDNASEYPIEEFNWACGAERSDSSGADVISTSLGYGYGFNGGIPDYPYPSLDGNTTMSAIAADLAAKKGILVFAAAGNAGSQPWHFIITPADGDSVVAVGAVSSAGAVGSFSSYGPSGDGQIKPDVASVGVNALVQSTSNTVVTSNGTSFACPNMAGLGTCLWQAFPEFNNMKIVNALRQAGHKANNPDDRVGYGIPNMKLAFSNLLTEYATSSSALNGCRVTLNWNSKDVSAMKYEIERKAPGETSYTKVGDVPAQAGVTLAARSYQFTNDLISGSTGNYSYRIRQIVDTTTAGFAAAYIDTTNINVPTPCIVTGVGNPPITGIHLSVRPNPSTGNNPILVVETPGSVTRLSILVYDNKGRLMTRIDESKGPGTKTITIPAGKLAKGEYYIRVMDGSTRIGTVSWMRL
ncbi:MAG: S8 family serine peptidase [Chitinophagaceae bacterium]